MKNGSKFFRGLLALAALGAFATISFSQLPANVTVEPFYDTVKVNLKASLVKPVGVAEVPGLPKHLFVIDLKGKLWGIFPDTTGYSGMSWYNYTGTNYKKVLLADFSSETAYSAEGEAGAYSVAFPPNYATTRKFYVYYYRKDSAWASTLPAASNTVTPPATFPGKDNFGNAAGVITLDEYQVDAADITKVTRLRVGIFKYFHQPAIGGGSAAFGPDGYLYLTVSDYNGSARNLRSYARKVLRIDVTSTPPAGAQYVIPPDNPYVNDPDTSIKREIWAIGFRNPWTIAFDWDTRDLWLGDVDQSNWEELNLVVKKGNYGWDRGADYSIDGNTGPNGVGNSFSGPCGSTTQLAAPTSNRPTDCTPFTSPAVSFPRTGGVVNLNCIIVGTVFRGAQTSPFYGRVIGTNNGTAAPLWAFKKGDPAPNLIGNVSARIGAADHRGIAAMFSGVGGTVYVPMLDWFDPANRRYSGTSRYFEIYRLSSPDLTLKSYSEVTTDIAIEKARVARRTNQPRLMVNLGFSAKENAGITYSLSGKLTNSQRGTGVYYQKPVLNANTKR